ncbi:MAG: tetratricopeptide repeat protein [Gemmatimonadales bacterium]
MNFEKLKETARKYEQKEEWRKAIEVYLQAVREFEAGNDPVPDLSVYNRVGDLYLKANEPGAAVQAYERAADLYGEQGFYNNAIALCGKILRVNPGRIQTYLKLAHLHARKNVVIEAKKNLLEYLERMNALNQLDDAFKSVKDFADQFPGNKEIRLMLSELLRASSRNAEAREQLEKLASDLEARGDTIGARKTLMRLQALDAEETTTAPESTKPAAGPRPRSGDLVFLDTGSELPRAPARSGPGSRKTRAVVIPPQPAPPTPPPASPPLVSVDASAAPPRPTASVPLEIEKSHQEDTPLDLHSLQMISDEGQLEATASGEVVRALGFEPTQDEAPEDVQVQPLDGLELDQPAAEGPDLIAAGQGLDLERASEPDSTVYASLLEDDGAGAGPVDAAVDLVAIDAVFEAAATDDELPRESLGLELLTTDVGEGEALEFEDSPVDDEATVTYLDIDAPAEPSITDLEDRVLDDPEDPEAHRALGEALIAVGEQLRGQEELELALAGYESREDWIHAGDLIQELIRLDPNGVRYHQKRVEISFRGGDRTRLIEAYVELADALLRVGALDKALSVYRRVAEHDPGNRRVLAALDALAPLDEAMGPPISPAPASQAPPAVLDEVADDADSAVEAMFGAPEPAPVPTKRPSRKTNATPRPAEPEPEVADGTFVDLGAFILDDDHVMDPRMRVGSEEQTGDEQKDFNDMLSQFKRGIDENIDADDYQAHYDLGVAFKEMGLLDEAISEFQKSLRAPEGRLKTSEALGSAFFEKGQFAIAEAILRRAVESLGATDDSQIGLLYWLGRSQEAQGKAGPAITNFERVLAVDIGFQDTNARMTRLAAGRPA